MPNTGWSCMHLGNTDVALKLHLPCRGDRIHIFRLRLLLQNFWIRIRVWNFFKYENPSDPCSNSDNHRCNRNSVLFEIKQWHLQTPHRLLLLLKIKSDFGSGKKTQNHAGVDSGSLATSAPLAANLGQRRFILILTQDTVLKRQLCTPLTGSLGFFREHREGRWAAGRWGLPRLSLWPFSIFPESKQVCHFRKRLPGRPEDWAMT